MAVKQYEGGEKMTETYKAELMCSNCNNSESVNVPKGTTKRGFAEENHCSECGCKKLFALN